MPLLAKAYRIAAYYGALAFFAALALALNCLCLVVAWLPACDGRERFFQRLVHRSFAFFIRCMEAVRVLSVRYEGFGRWPADAGLVVVANHPGLMDVGWLVARMPEVMCVYKPAVGNSPLFGATARCAGYLPGNRAYHLLRTAAAKIAAGRTLLVFPEGTRTLGGSLNPLMPGFVAIARMARVRIQLVRITCDSELLTKGRALWMVPRLPATVTVALGPCLPAPGRDTSAVVGGIEAWFRNPPGPGCEPAGT